MTVRGLIERLRSHALGVVLLIGLILRLIGIQSRSLQYDDVFSIFLSARSLPEIVSGTAADTMPPLYYFLLHFWMLAAQTGWFIRLLSIVLSLLSLVLFYYLVASWSNREVAFWAALLAAISPLQIYHAQDVRMYALLVLGQLGYLWFFTRIWKNAHAGRSALLDWGGLVLCGAATMYTHNVAIFGLIAPNLFLLFRRAWKQLAQLILAQLVIALLALPWLLLLPGQITKVQRAWTLPQPGFIELVQALIMSTASLPLTTALMALAFLISLQILIMLCMELYRARRDLPGIPFWLTLLLLPPLLLFVASFIIQPIFIPRAFLISYLAYDVLAGLIIARTWSRGVGKVLAGAFILAAVISLPSYYSFDEFPRSPYRQAVQYLEQNADPQDIIIHETKLSYFPARFYAPDLKQVFLADWPGTPNDTFEPGSQEAMQIFPLPDLESAITGSGDIYFITFTETFREYVDLGIVDHPRIAWLDDHFKRVDRIILNDLEIFHYER